MGRRSPAFAGCARSAGRDPGMTFEPESERLRLTPRQKKNQFHSGISVGQSPSGISVGQSLSGFSVGHGSAWWVG